MLSFKNGVQVDPYKQKLPPSDPVKKENREAYEVLKDSMMLILQDIPLKLMLNKQLCFLIRD